jgi:hypothetical protein
MSSVACSTQPAILGVTVICVPFAKRWEDNENEEEQNRHSLKIKKLGLTPLQEMNLGV